MAPVQQLDDGYGASKLSAELEEKLISLQVFGEVRVKASLPGDRPKVQVKLALPEDCLDFQVSDAALGRMPGVHDAAALRAAAAVARSRTAGAARTVACIISAPTVTYAISICWLAPKSHRRAMGGLRSTHRLSQGKRREEAPVASVGRCPDVA